MANFSDALVKVTLWKNGEQVAIPQDGIDHILMASYQNEGIDHGDGTFYLTGRWSLINLFDSNQGADLLRWLYDQDYERALFDFAEIEMDMGFALHGTLDVTVHQKNKLIHVTAESIEWTPQLFNTTHLFYPFPTCDEDDEDAMDDMADDFNEAYDVIQSTIFDRYVGQSSPRHYKEEDGEYTHDCQLITMD